METVIVNWSGSGMRRETFRGRSYLVAPMTMIKAGAVLNGSQGPLLYPADEVSKNPGIWDHIPLTVNHPTDEQGNPVRARTPKTLERHQIGYVFNDSFTGTSRDAEGWFDVESTRQLAPAILKRLEAGQPIELSTGLHTRNEPVQNGKTSDGRAYSHVARDYVPDHLAILPDQVGACSLKDGCGVLRNELCENCGGKGGKPGPCATGDSDSSEHGPHKVGSSVHFREPTVHYGSGGNTPQTGTKKVVGRVTVLKPNGMVEIKRQDGGYSVKHHSEVTANTGETNMNKAELVTHLTTNCSCYKGKEKVLNELDEDALAELKKDQDELTENRLVVNSVKQFLGKDDLTVNAMPAALMAAKAPPAAPPVGPPVPPKKKPKPGCEEEDDMTKNFENFLDLPAEQRMTPDELRAMQFASGMEQQYKRQLVDKVVSNHTTDPKQQKLVRPMYEGMTLNQLQVLVANTAERTQVQKQAETPLTDFFGLGLVANRGGQGPVVDPDNTMDKVREQYLASLSK